MFALITAIEPYATPRVTAFSEADGAPRRQEKMEEQERKKQAREQALRDKAKQMMEEFKQEWEPVMSNLDAAVKAFDDLEGIRHSVIPLPI